MVQICMHLGFHNEPELFPELGEVIDVYILKAKKNEP
jgi:hypothetical protein